LLLRESRGKAAFGCGHDCRKIGGGGRGFGVGVHRSGCRVKEFCGRACAPLCLRPIWLLHSGEAGLFFTSKSTNFHHETHKFNLRDFVQHDWERGLVDGSQNSAEVSFSQFGPMV